MGAGADAGVDAGLDARIAGVGAGLEDAAFPDVAAEDVGEHDAGANDGGPPPSQDAGTPCQETCLDERTLQLCTVNTGAPVTVPCGAAEVCDDAECVPVPSGRDAGTGACEPGCVNEQVEGACSATGRLIVFECDPGEACLDGACKPVEGAAPGCQCDATSGSSGWLFLALAALFLRRRLRKRGVSPREGRSNPLDLGRPLSLRRGDDAQRSAPR